MIPIGVVRPVPVGGPVWWWRRRRRRRRHASDFRHGRRSKSSTKDFGEEDMAKMAGKIFGECWREEDFFCPASVGESLLFPFLVSLSPKVKMNKRRRNGRKNIRRKENSKFISQNSPPRLASRKAGCFVCPLSVQMVALGGMNENECMSHHHLPSRQKRMWSRPKRLRRTHCQIHLPYYSYVFLQFATHTHPYRISMLWEFLI